MVEPFDTLTIRRAAQEGQPTQKDGANMDDLSSIRRAANDALPILPEQVLSLCNLVEALVTERDMIERHYKEACQMRDLFHEREQAACKECERLAPLARESYQLRADLMLAGRRIEVLETRAAHDREDYACLIGVARDNNWEGVSEGLHAYAWDAFLQSRVGRADRNTRWRHHWKAAAKRHRRKGN